MLRKNKKNALIGICALAGVALTSVGFATWVFGISNKDASLEYSVQVDDVSSDTVYLEVGAQTQSTIKVGEKTQYTKGNKDIAGTGSTIEAYANALEFSIANITIKLGEQAIKPTKLNIELKNETKLNEINKVKAENIKIKTLNNKELRKDSETYYYFLYTKTIAIDFGEGKNFVENTKASGTEYKTYKFNNTENQNIFKDSLNWGNFFESSKSPVEFYNSIYGSETSASLDELLSASNSAFEEVSAMKAQLEGETKKLTLSISLA